MKLFDCYSVVDEFSFRNWLFDEVHIGWIVTSRKDDTPKNYKELIEDYDENNQNCMYPRAAVDEAFTESEIEQLKQYLENLNRNFEIEEINLPFGNNWSGVSTLPIGSWEGFYPLYLEDSYNLPFEVEGYFRITDELKFKKTFKNEINYLKKILATLNFAPPKDEEIKEAIKQLEKEGNLISVSIEVKKSTINKNYDVELLPF